jgi:uncharacterized membrane protein
MKHWRYNLFLAVTALSAWPLSQVMTPVHAALAAFNAGALVFVASCLGLWLKGSAERFRGEAERDDANEALLLVLTGTIVAVIMAALVSLVTERPALPTPLLSLLVATLALSWLFTNLIFTFHYARLYYAKSTDGGDFGGLDFPGGDDPDFTDFVNFAFVIGMTCQTADINITHRKMRRVATGHGLYAFVFNLGILALVVNVVASV